MISIVVCSLNKQYLDQLQQNVENTIGVDYELLFWDNKKENKGICEVYNLMAKQARFSIICFLHEDILFQSIDWGRILLQHFQNDEEIGAIGLAGAKYKSAICSGWYTGIHEVDCANITHRYPWGDQLISLSPDNKTIQEVVCLDGVFIAVRQDIWKKYRFDEENLKGFHFYDLDFSLRVNKEFRCMVVYDIPLIHLTKGGDFGNPWVETALEFHQGNKILPRSVLKVDLPGIERRIAVTWFDVLKHQRISFSNKWRWVIQQHLLRPGYFYSIVKLLLYKSLGLHKIHKRVRKND